MQVTNLLTFYHRQLHLIFLKPFNIFENTAR